MSGLGCACIACAGSQVCPPGVWERWRLCTARVPSLVWAPQALHRLCFGAPQVPDPCVPQVSHRSASCVTGVRSEQQGVEVPWVSALSDRYLCASGARSLEPVHHGRHTSGVRTPLKARKVRNSRFDTQAGQRDISPSRSERHGCARHETKRILLHMRLWTLEQKTKQLSSSTTVICVFFTKPLIITCIPRCLHTSAESREETAVKPAKH